MNWDRELCMYSRVHTHIHRPAVYVDNENENENENEKKKKKKKHETCISESKYCNSVLVQYLIILVPSLPDYVLQGIYTVRHEPQQVHIPYL